MNEAHSQTLHSHVVQKPIGCNSLRASEVLVGLNLVQIASVSSTGGNNSLPELQSPLSHWHLKMLLRGHPMVDRHLP